MILAYLEGIPSFFKSPVTWVLIVINILIQVISAPFDMDSARYRESLFGDQFFIRTQGRIYADYLVTHPGDYSDYIVDVATLAQLGNHEKVDLLGQIAFQDTRFLSSAKDGQWGGDEVAFKYWKSEIDTFEENSKHNPKHVFGLVGGKPEWYRWVSYAFIHDGISHLLFNLWFLLIFGGYLERRIGSRWFLFSYLVAGAFSGFAFEVFSGLSGMPLVGASGAISGLMGVFIVVAWNKRLKLKVDVREGGEETYVYLPAWFDVAAWFLMDVGGYLQSIKELGGVAHITHISGLFFGVILAGLVLRSKMDPPGESGLTPRWSSAA